MTANEASEVVQMHNSIHPTSNAYLHCTGKSDSILTKNSKHLSLANNRLSQRTGIEDQETHQQIKRRIQKWPKRGLIQMSRSLSKQKIKVDTQLLRTTLVLQRLERKIPQEMLQTPQRRPLKPNRAFSARKANQMGCSV